MEEEEVVDVSATSSPVVVTAPTATTASEDILRVQEPAIVRAKGRSNSGKSFRRAGLPRRLRYLRLSLNKPLGTVMNVNENEDEDEDGMKQEVKQEVIRLQAFQTSWWPLFRCNKC